MTLWKRIYTTNHTSRLFKKIMRIEFKYIQFLELQDIAGSMIVK